MSCQNSAIDNEPALTYGNIVRLFSCLGNPQTGHKGINTFFHGDRYRMPANIEYPLLFLDIANFGSSAVGDPATGSQAGRVRYDFTWCILDRTDLQFPDRSLKQILEKTRDIAEQIIWRMIRDSKARGCCIKTLWDINWAWGMEDITDEANTWELKDEVTGWQIRMSIEGIGNVDCQDEIQCANIFDCCFCGPASY